MCITRNIYSLHYIAQDPVCKTKLDYAIPVICSDLISITVMIRSFRTDMPGQTVQTQIRLRVYTVCHSACIVWTHYIIVEPHSLNFRVITTNFLGVRIFRKFTVLENACTSPSTLLHSCMREHLTKFAYALIQMYIYANLLLYRHFFHK